MDYQRPRRVIKKPTVIHNVLCFSWKDNNTELGLTTAHSVHHTEEDTIEVERCRPKKTCTNAKITLPVFEGQPSNLLRIPTVIDDYNHRMNGVDIANQLRAWMTVSRRGIYKGWQSL